MDRDRELCAKAPSGHGRKGAAEQRKYYLCRGAVKARLAVFFGAFLAIFKSARHDISEAKHFMVFSVRTSNSASEK